MTPIKIGLGFVGMFTVLLTFALSRVPAEKQTQAQVPSEKFDETWSDVLRPLSVNALRKADNERAPIDSNPKPVTVERIMPDTPSPAMAVVPQPVQRPHIIKRPVEHDACTRHKMHKVFYNGGKKWRCRK